MLGVGWGRQWSELKNTEKWVKKLCARLHITLVSSCIGYIPSLGRSSLTLLLFIPGWNGVALLVHRPFIPWVVEREVVWGGVVNGSRFAPVSDIDWLFDRWWLMQPHQARVSSSSVELMTVRSFHVGLLGCLSVGFSKCGSRTIGICSPGSLLERQHLRPRPRLN